MPLRGCERAWWRWWRRLRTSLGYRSPMYIAWSCHRSRWCSVESIAKHVSEVFFFKRIYSWQITFHHAHAASCLKGTQEEGLILAHPWSTRMATLKTQRSQVFSSTYSFHITALHADLSGSNETGWIQRSNKVQQPICRWCQRTMTSIFVKRWPAGSPVFNSQPSAIRLTFRRWHSFRNINDETVFKILSRSHWTTAIHNLNCFAIVFRLSINNIKPTLRTMPGSINRNLNFKSNDVRSYFTEVQVRWFRCKVLHQHELGSNQPISD